MQLQVKKLKPNAIIPTQASTLSAGFDLYACIDHDVTIKPGETAFIGTGLAMAIPAGFGAFIYARSGLACKKNLRPANCVGVIDADYRGEYMVALHNDGSQERTIANGERIAQMVISQYFTPTFNIVDELPDSERGAGGFGSSGK